MASADLRDELLCSICLTIYTDPVTLRCGHNFCRVCIDQDLNTQDGSGVYSCPECREELQERPALQRNTTLRNVVERVLSTQPHQEKITGICCTYCIHSPVPAVKSCLLCEASLCKNHLKVHSKAAEHVLSDPSTSLENRKCSVHKKLLKYYCAKDAVCICVSCSLAGEHRGHRVEMLDEASEKKKKKLRNVLQKLITKRKKTQKRVKSLGKRWRKAQEKVSGEAERVTALFIDIRRRLDDLEKRILSEISRQEEKMSLSLSDVIQKLEIKKDELSRKMRHIEELCNMTDPLTVLQEPDTGDLCDPEEEGGGEDTGGHDGGDEDTGGHDKIHDVDVDVITGMLHAGFSDIMTNLQTISPTKPRKKRPQPPSARSLPSHIQDLPLSGTEYGGDDVVVRTGGAGRKVTAAGKGGVYGEGPADILLDVNTAANDILKSDDLKTATKTDIEQNHPETAERFQNSQVISSKRFTTGRHYWDLETTKSWSWRVGMCYPSIGVGGKVLAAGKGGIYGEGPADILLDINTADNILISDDLKTATWTNITPNRPETAERFLYWPQVISSKRFTSGRHYWDVEISELWAWSVGMCYPSIDRTGNQSLIGNNNKSWCLCRKLFGNNPHSVIHDWKEIQLPHQISSDRFRICLDYEAGQLSFYELCDPIRHLHTFTATFSEPLHAALWVCGSSIKILGEQRL